MRRFCYLIFILSLIYASFAFAEEDEKDYARAALNGLKINHFAKHISLPLEPYFNFDYGKNYTQSILYFKPVVPFRLTDDLDLIIRTIAPIYERAPIPNNQNIFTGRYINGWGDFNPTFFITPARFNHFIMGLGPTISIPTSTNNKNIGTGKWSIGPELALYYLSKNWIIGCLTYNMWSIAGDEARPSVNNFQFQYQVSLLLNKGWYIATNPTITANWNAPANQRWVVPFGIGVGKVIKFGQQPINFAAYSYYNAIRPTQLGPNWQIQLQVEWLFKSFYF